MTSVASAQSLPGHPAADGPVQQQMLAGEASAVAQFLEISPEQLQSELAGHSLAHVTQQHGKSVADVTAVVVRAAHEQLDAAVSVGQLPGDEAARYKTQISLFAPLLVTSQEASALALQAAEG